ncbi:MAG: TRAP transporter large permease subunit [Octadecabacter sp.]|nr:TRAP transporter large permease subunit [Octadecabacter sp.]
MLIFTSALPEGGEALIILTLLLVPLTQSLGINPVLLGIVNVQNLTIAGVMPAIGTLMNTTCFITGVSIADFNKKAIPLLIIIIIIMIVALLMVTLIPIISLWLPKLVYGEAPLVMSPSMDVEHAKFV